MTAKSVPEFFKVILTPMEGFKIPKAYMRTYGNTLENTLLLKVPSGATWPVGLVYKDGGAWVQNGWKDFQEYYSIQWGYFLVFTYEQNSSFFVKIFDANGSEIDYLSKPSVRARANCRQQVEEPQDDVSFETFETEEEDVSVETLESEDEFSETDEEYVPVATVESEDDVSIEIIEATPLQMRPGKRAAREPESQARNYSRKQYLNEDDGVRRGRSRQGKAKITYSSSSEEEESWEEMSRQSKVNQSGESSGAKDKSFTCIIREAYVTGRFIMHCPFSFASRHFPAMVPGCPVKIEVVDPMGNRWEIKYAMRGHRAQWYGPGWKGLVRENRLSIGDVCDFEQVQKNVFHLRIIYRKTN